MRTCTRSRTGALEVAQTEGTEHTLVEFVDQRCQRLVFRRVTAEEVTGITLTACSSYDSAVELGQLGDLVVTKLRKRHGKFRSDCSVEREVEIPHSGVVKNWLFLVKSETK